MYDFNKAQTYQRDLPLFLELGFETFSTDSNEELFVAKYKLAGYDDKVFIKVWVTCWPAQFWRFQIDTSEGYRVDIETGSGTLTDFWPSVLLVATDMFVFK